MAPASIPPKRSTPSSSTKLKARTSAGFTLVELLVAAAIGLLVITLALELTLSARSVYNLDTARTRVNQNLRSALDLLRDDVRQAGERFPANFPAIEVLDTPEGRELVLRKNLTEEVLPVCVDLNQGSHTDILIEKTTYNVWLVGPQTLPSANAECPAATSSTATWEAYRQAAGGTLRVFVYDALAKKGSFIDVVAIGSKLVGNYAGPTGWITYPGYSDALTVSGTWPRKFEAAKQPRVYLVDERRYRLRGDTLQLVVNGADEDNQVKNVAGSIAELAVDAYTMDGSTLKRMHGDGTVTTDDNWQTIASIRVTLTGQASVGGRSVTRKLTVDALPRNVFSR